MKYSPDILSILRRKVVTRDILFSYLDEKNIAVKLPATKNDLIDKVVEYLNIPRTSVTTSAEENQTANNTSLECRTNIGTETTESNNIGMMATQFTKWFYDLMNSGGVGSEHFYSDAKLTLNLISESDHDSKLVENDPEEISRVLLSVQQQHNLFFNPNISKEGTQGRIDPHGLVIVIVCGTLHVQDVCAGVFEQVFSLARDPFCDNNWKIKNSELNLKSKSGILGPPQLCDSELTSNLLMLPDQ